MEANKDVSSETPPVGQPDRESIKSTGDPVQQNIEQTTSNQTSAPALPGKKQINYWIFLPIGLLIVLAGGILWLVYRNKENINSSPNSAVLSPTTTVPIALTSLDIKAQSIGDKETELYLSENNSVYNIKQNNQINKLASFDGNITNILFLPNRKDLVVVTENPETLKETYNEATKKMEPTVDSHTAYWILKTDTQKIEKFPFTLSEILPLRDIEEMTIFEQISTKENQSGGADILLDKSDGSTPVKIGSLKEKLLERPICEIGNNCIQKFFPKFFIPSFDGSYLLSRSPRGGGLGEPAIVVSKDGTRSYKIDFYWYVSSAIWISDNKLLAQDQKGARIFTFNTDGTFQTTDIKVGIGDQFDQKTLSPDKKYVGVITYNPNYEVSLFDVATFERKVIETIKSGSIDPNTIHIIGWNSGSSKLLYVVEDNAKIYDMKTGISSVAASLANGIPDWVSTNKALFAQHIFEIR